MESKKKEKHGQHTYVHTMQQLVHFYTFDICYSDNKEMK